MQKSQLCIKLQSVIFDSNKSLIFHLHYTILFSLCQLELKEQRNVWSRCGSSSKMEFNSRLDEKLSAAAKIKDSNRWHRNICFPVCICDENKNLWFSCNPLIVKEDTKRTAVRKTKFSFALIGETRKKESFSIKYAVNKAFITWKIPVSPKIAKRRIWGILADFSPSECGLFKFSVLLKKS